jgi:hypothetical protein
LSRERNTYVRNEKACKILAGKPEGKRPLGRFRRIWKVILKYSFEVGCESAEWIYLAYPGGSETSQRKSHETLRGHLIVSR